MRSEPDRAQENADQPVAFRRTLIRVMLVQVVTLTLLWLLQRHYS